MKKRWILFLLVLLATISIARAELKVDSHSIKNTIFPWQEAEFSVDVTDSINEQLSLSYSEDYWRAKIDPRQLNMVAGQPVYGIKVFLYPLNNARPGSYLFKLRFVNGEPKIVQEHPLNVVLADKNKAIDVQVLTPRLEPGLNENLLQLRLTNNYDIDMKELKVGIDSKLFTHDTSVDLGPMESKVIEMVVKLDKTIIEGDYDVNVNFMLDNQQLTTVRKRIGVGKVSQLTSNIDFAGGLFTKVKEVEFVNEGNTIARQTYTESIGWLEDLFTSTTPKPTSVQKENGQRLLVWQLTLNPGQKQVIAVTTGYRGAIIVLILLLGMVGLWYIVFGREVTITKKVVNTSHEHDAFGSIKVNLHIKNRGKHRMYNLRVLDKIPGYVMPVKEEFSGMHPLSMKRTVGGGMALIWNVPGIDANGEHVISYRIKTKLPVFGKVMLPTATVRYRNEKGKVLNSYSNRMILFSLPGHGEQA